MINIDKQDMQDTGNRIRTIRQSKNMTAAVLARRVGISEAALSRIENGEASPNSQNLFRISEELEVSLSALQPTKLDQYSPKSISIFAQIFPHLAKFNQKTLRTQEMIAEIIAAIFVRLLDRTL